MADALPHLVSGFRVLYYDHTRPQHASDIQAIWATTVPPGWNFQSLSENQAFCAKCRLTETWLCLDIQRGVKPPSELLAALLRRPLFVADVSRFCPQVVLLLLLRRIEAGLEELWGSDVGQPDLFAFSSFNRQYDILKFWMQDVVFPGTPWTEIVANWSVDALEASNYATYQRLYNSLWNSAGRGFAGADPVRAEPGGSGADLHDELKSGCAGGRSYTFLRASEDARQVASLEGPVPVNMAMVGNALSLYWQGRGLARLAGIAFVASGGRGEGSFVQHLPRTVSAPGVFNFTALREACAACRAGAGNTHPHMCLGSWTHVLGQVRADMSRALRLSGAEAAARSQLRPQDAVISLRCTPNFNQDYPLAAFSFYEALPDTLRTSSHLRFVIVAGHLGPTCFSVATALEAFLRRRYPGVDIVRRFAAADEVDDRAAEGRRVLSHQPGGDEATELDFALLAFAPVLFRAPGSFSLWAGLTHGDGGASGVVLSTFNPEGSTWDWKEAAFGRNWAWVQAPMLTRGIRDRHSFSFGHPEPWIHWLETH